MYNKLVIEKIKEKALQNEVPIIKDGGLLYMLNLIKNNHFKEILELGTAVGYSAINIAKLAKDIHVDTLEKNEDMYNQAIANIHDEGLDEQITCYLTPIEDFDTKKKYDFIFIDAAKAQYGKYLEQFIDNLKEDGIILFDNMIFHGMIYNIDSIHNRGTRSLVKKILMFRKNVANDERFDIIFEDEVGDGLLILRRRKKVDNIQAALLGFVEAAKDYLDKHVDEKIEGLDSFGISNLEKLILEENNKDTLNSDMVKQGKLAFEDYLKEKINPNKRNIIDELGEIFDVDFFDDNEVKNVVEDKKEYEDDLENIFFGIDDDNEILKAISEATKNSNEEINVPSYNGVPDGLDDIYKDVIEHEDEQNIEETLSFGNLFEPLEEKKEEKINIFEEVQEYRPFVLNPGILMDDVKVEDEEEEKEEVLSDGNTISPSETLLEILDKDMPIVETIVDQEQEPIEEAAPSYHFLPNPCFDVEEKKEEKNVVDESKEIVTKTEIEKASVQEAIKEEEKEEPYIFTIIENPGLDVIFKDDVATKSKKDIYEEIQNLRLDKEETTENKEEIEEVKEEIKEKKEETIEDKKDLYMDSLLQDLDEHFKMERPLETVNSKERIYDTISNLSPFLSRVFIKSAYDLKEEIANTYKPNESIILLHRIFFREVEYLRRFAEIMLNHDYQINVDEKQMIVDTFKNYVNEDGLILNEIFSIANQAKLLCGDYEGYRILTKEDF